MLCAGLVVAPGLVHFDDSDAQLYQVVIRNLVRDHAWLNTRYLPDAYSQFREHLPFGFWPYVVVSRVAGEWAEAWIATAMTLGTLAILGWAARRLFDSKAAFAAVLLLGTCPSFFHFGTRTLLEPPLLLFVTVSIVPLVFPRTSPLGWCVAVAGAALGGLVKGPLGVVPFACAAAAQAYGRRSLVPLLMGGVGLAVAAAPFALFLVWARNGGDPSWWTGYGQGQLFATMAGSRDTVLPPWYPLVSSAERMWLAMALGVFALVAPRLRWWRPDGEPLGPERRRTVRQLGVLCLLLFVALALPQRKMWSHALIAYPALSLLGAGGASMLLARLAAARTRQVGVALAGLALAGWIAAFAGAGRLLVPRPCVSSKELAAWLDPLRPGTPVLVVDENVAWGTMANLAAERDLLPSPVERLPPATSLGPNGGAQWALVREAQLPVDLRAWAERARARGWVLLERQAL